MGFEGMIGNNGLDYHWWAARKNLMSRKSPCELGRAFLEIAHRRWDFKSTEFVY
jgi:hypothetical protein